ncbi:MAG: UDP-glucose--hexose-1-phosphate uridylyltransferase [Armatimonadetes bacterium]|jgi:UDPglucose--hexose-1-phosphate uridylyltransferase|nr:UDP-glucose--hexose-1-phosphate uridylyltransferase [Armatimonadota bacterium]
MSLATVLAQRPHRRFNPLTREWVLVSPHRVQRPWQGSVEQAPTETRPAYDPGCYLCPGNERAEPPGGGPRPRNPQYEGTFVFQNDFSALLPGEESEEVAGSSLLRARPERGVCRVVVFSPRHDLTLAQMPVEAIRAVVDTWTEEYQALGALPWIQHVQIFENKGAIMGCSNPHPHGQIWAQESVPGEPARELASLVDYREAHGGRCLLCDYLAEEVAAGERLVCRNAHFSVVVPFWAVWPFETMVLSHRHVGSLAELTEAERDALADILRRLTTRYDNVFNVSFPYSMGMHQSPTDGAEHPECHFHLHFYPPLLRSAQVKKFMVGYEMLAEPQRDITAETSAERLRSRSETHG